MTHEQDLLFLLAHIGCLPNFMTGGQRFLMAGNGIRLFRGTCAYFIFSSWRALRARASELELGASVRSAAGGAYSGLCTQGQGETSIYCTARSSKKEGEQTLDGAHPRLAQPTCPLGASSKFRLAGRARLFRGPGFRRHTSPHSEGEYGATGIFGQSTLYICRRTSCV